MKVDSDSSNNAALNARRAQRLQRRLVKQKEQEIANIKKVYQDRIGSVKLTQQRKLTDLNDVHRNAMEERVIIGQEKLEKYKTDLNKEQNQLSRKLENYQADLAKRTDLLKKNHQTQHKIHSDRLNEQAVDAKVRLVNHQKQLKSDSKFAINRAIREKNAIANNLASDNVKHQASIRLKEKEIVSQQRMNKRQELKAQTDFRLTMQQLRLDAQKDIHKQELMNKKNFETVQSNHSRRLMGRQEAFKQKLVAMKNAQEQLTKRIKDKYSTQLQKLVAQSNLQREHIATRSQDTFYQMRHLTPTIKDGGDHYLLSVPVAPHERDNISLAANERELVLTFTRRFNQNNRDQAGNNEITKRSEVLSSRIKTPDIITTNDLVSSYHDNQLVFKIKKK